MNFLANIEPAFSFIFQLIFSLNSHWIMKCFIQIPLQNCHPHFTIYLLLSLILLTFNYYKCFFSGFGPKLNFSFETSLDSIMIKSLAVELCIALFPRFEGCFRSFLTLLPQFVTRLRRYIFLVRLDCDILMRLKFLELEL